MDKSTLVGLAEVTYRLVDQADDSATLTRLAKVALEVKQLLDDANIEEDLGTDLLEFAQLKRDGNEVGTNKFRDSARELLESARVKVA